MTHAALLALLLALNVGSPAPDWKLQGSDGKTYALSDFKGKQGVVIAWFPKAGTSGCTAELRDMRDRAAEIAAYDATVFLASLDPPERNAEWAKEEGAKQVILSDPTGDVAKAYDVAGIGALFAKRWTFYIDKDGTVVAIDKNVNTAAAGADIAKKLGELGYPKR
jgi:peroxiredoxin Q/BCP